MYKAQAKAIIRLPENPNRCPSIDDRRHKRRADVSGRHLEPDDRLRIVFAKALRRDMDEVGKHGRASQAVEQQPRERKFLRQRQREQQRAAYGENQPCVDQRTLPDPHGEQAGDHPSARNAEEKQRAPTRGDARFHALRDEIRRRPEPDGSLPSAVEKE